VTVLLNGVPHDTTSGQTIAGLISELGIDPRNVGVERNRAIVPKSAYASTVMHDDDRIEIVQFVGGG
jgi:thiamine biosynthesis protein ThiS